MNGRETKKRGRWKRETDRKGPTRLPFTYWGRAEEEAKKDW